MMQLDRFSLPFLDWEVSRLPFVIAGATLLIQGGVGLYWTVPAVMFSFLVVLMEAWILLVETNR